MPFERETLLQFHKSHFSTLPFPPLLHPTLGFDPSNALHTLERPIPPDSDSLGHYEDGVESTLTDEQIAIFRHTEIQELLKERQATSDIGAELQPICDMILDPASPQRSQSQPFMPLEVNEGDICESEDRSSCNDDAGSMDWQKVVTKQHLTHLDHVEHGTGERLPAGWAKSWEKKTCAGKVLAHDEMGDPAQSLDQTAAEPSGEANTRAKFLWPDLREQR